jgi:hypothetical protein
VEDSDAIIELISIFVIEAEGAILDVRAVREGGDRTDLRVAPSGKLSRSRGKMLFGRTVAAVRML